MQMNVGKKNIAIGAVIFCISAFLAVGGSMAWAQTYDGRMGPRTSVGSVDVSGLDRETARQRVQEAVDVFFTSGAPLVLEGKPASLPLSYLSGSDAVEIVSFRVDEAIDAAYAKSHDANGLFQAGKLLASFATPRRVGVRVTGNDESIRERVRAAFPDVESPFQNTSFAFRWEQDGWKAIVVDGIPGDEFDFGPFLETLSRRLAGLDRTPTPLEIAHRTPDVTTGMAEALADRAVALLSRQPAPFHLATKDENDAATDSWTVTADLLAGMLVPGADGKLAVDAEAFAAFFDPIAAEVEVEPTNARFSMADGRVTEFASSSPGVAIDREKLDADVRAALNEGDETATVTLALTVVEPEIKTADANDIGIVDVLGVGASSYRGSPGNRIKNIRNGVSFLNGRLIAPGETFSLLDALKPFELDNGYLPELVIKGDKIQPEIAGGLCQIGTTTFRAALNSGLPIDERSNHSLVVSYYNDPSNGNPGTDATIYDPAPDLKFTNDTGNFILFQAEMLEESQDLRFTFWGTSDGRKGSYSPPEVIRWIGVGETIRTETLDLEPGVEKCQAAHVGADTSFTYTIVNPDGTVTERVFASHYRPLPTICLVGVEELSTPDDLQPTTDSVTSSETADAPVEDDAGQTDVQ